jgi:hypothetical protein
LEGVMGRQWLISMWALLGITSSAAADDRILYYADLPRGVSPVGNYEIIEITSLFTFNWRAIGRDQRQIVREFYADDTSDLIRLIFVRNGCTAVAVDRVASNAKLGERLHSPRGPVT